MKYRVNLIDVMSIPAHIATPTKCRVCELWGIDRDAAYFSQWEEQYGTDNYIGVCENDYGSGFEVIGSIEEFEEVKKRGGTQEEVAEIIQYDEDPIYSIIGRHVKTKTLKQAGGISRTATFYRAIRTMIQEGYAVIYIAESDEGKTFTYEPHEIGAVVMDAMELEGK